MRRQLLSLAAMLVVLTALATPAMAGGWASVRLDEPPPPYQEVPWTIGFTVKQHDMTPINVEHAYLAATHRATGETVTADAVQEGEVGHFTVTVTFPTAGDWKWSITPEPFAGTSFPTLHVLSGPSDTAGATNAAAPPALGPQPVHIHSGSCAALGDVVFPLNDVGTGLTTDGTPVAAGATIGPAAVPVAISNTTVDATLESLADGNHAINVHKSATEIGAYVACGDIGGQPMGDELVVGLEPLNDSGEAGVAVLQGTGAQTTVTLYVLMIQRQTGTPTASTGATAEVKLVGTGDGNWEFDPNYLEVNAGTTVTWTNETDVAHTVSGTTLDFEDSGYVDPGRSFSQTFTTPGTYTYHCDPHPWMTGTIVVMP